MDKDKLMYVGQKAFIDRNGEILVLMDPKIGLDFPGGKIQEGETSLNDSLKREVREETNLEIKIGDAFATWSFEFPPDHRNKGAVFLVGYKCTYISGEVELSDEHNNFRWVTKDTYHDLDDRSEYFQALDKYFDLET